MSKRSSGDIVILGGSGFLGAQLLAAMARSGEYRAVNACRHPERTPRFDRPEDFVAREAIDLLEPGALEELLERRAPSGVIHCAALSRGAACEQDPELAHRLNAELPAALGELCSERGIRLLHVSTDLVFGEIAPGPGGFREEDPPAPLGAYGSTKAEGERLLLAANAAALVVRLPLLYGDSGGRGLGASDQILTAVERGERPRLFVDEFRTPLAAEEASLALLELLGLEVSGFLHLAGPERLSRYQLGLAVLRGAGVEEPRAAACLQSTRQAELDLSAPRAADASLDAGRARGLLKAPLSSPERFLSSSRR